ncbi:MAG: NADH-quinone oxidoreductase subunit C [Candidatus Aerophobetes bacterium]
MSSPDPIAAIKAEFKDRIVSWEEKSPKRYYITMPREDITKVADFIFAKQGARFIIASGVDTPEAIEILYHFAFDKLNKILTVKVPVPKERCEIESIAPIIAGANWIEREIAELLGVNFLNHPNPKRLLLAEDWPEGKYPLRQEPRSNR